MKKLTAALTIVGWKLGLKASLLPCKCSFINTQLSRNNIFYPNSVFKEDQLLFNKQDKYILNIKCGRLNINGQNMELQ